MLERVPETFSMTLWSESPVSVGLSKDLEKFNN